MSKQKTFWAPLSGRNKVHLWTHSKYASSIRISLCGLYRFTPKIGIKGEGNRCKSCVRALET